MKFRTAIFDVYATLLEVGLPPVNGEALWQRLFETALGAPPPLSRTEFSVRASEIIAGRHASARARGIPWPEIQWPTVVRTAIPSVARMSAPKYADFLYQQMQIGRTLRLAEGASGCLRRLNEQGTLLGIASNSQAYTLRELTVALEGVGLNLSMFDRDLRFWSFEHGFSKPDPHAFRILTARLEARGINPNEVLMIGDRRDNDIAPARAQGWQTWWLTNSGNLAGEPGGNFRELCTAVERVGLDGIPGMESNQ